MKNILFLIVVLIAFVSCKNETKKEAVPVVDDDAVSDVVSVSGRQLLVNDESYLIKGICYHPVPKGTSTKRDFGTLTQDLELMVEAGINTIRVYAPIEDQSVLDEINEAGLKVIIGFGYKQGGKNDIFSGSFIEYVNKFKNHNAILMWELGNEYNYHPEWFGGDIKNWYKAMNDAAGLIHQNDPSHPVATAHGDLPKELALSMSPNIDVWGMNVYRSVRPETIFKEWKEVSTKPMYLAETGADSYMQIAKDGYEQGINELAQADATAIILKATFNGQDICSGVTLFQFTDGWWKAGNNEVQDTGGTAPNSTGVPFDGSPNEEFWGIVDIDRNKKKVFDVVKDIYINVNKTEK
ncbi:glycoside hydrolase family 2 TIM barrel-domain containing protein [Winogradskyella helgolandensis]|uniref:glycoside hydrolase family 2 TIM barrel-domain containing protein n=1 Tax=Winogradskyella helgolandensis TaxID=2697010 RepID=UPI0015B8552B|nr:glycoside hydrolase family 2 TIM barrel-domain containing protein [Winogradskyella helgolandensis]